MGTWESQSWSSLQKRWLELMRRAPVWRTQRTGHSHLQPSLPSTTLLQFQTNPESPMPLTQKSKDVWEDLGTLHTPGATLTVSKTALAKKAERKAARALAQAPGRAGSSICGVVRLTVPSFAGRYTYDFPEQGKMCGQIVDVVDMGAPRYHDGCSYRMSYVKASDGSFEGTWPYGWWSAEDNSQMNKKLVDSWDITQAAKNPSGMPPAFAAERVREHNGECTPTPAAPCSPERQSLVSLQM